MHLVAVVAVAEVKSHANSSPAVIATLAIDANSLTKWVVVAVVEVITAVHPPLAALKIVMVVDNNSNNNLLITTHHLVVKEAVGAVRINHHVNSLPVGNAVMAISVDFLMSNLAAVAVMPRLLQALEAVVHHLEVEEALDSNISSSPTTPARLDQQRVVCLILALGRLNRRHLVVLPHHQTVLLEVDHGDKGLSNIYQHLNIDFIIN
mmetsp:Transcript_25672/g.55219  ORF Transcript_25672/g.55219 Transcript_25672/m.55219 type:complete len:207 (+) Transcript_25672:3096-3716(+)